MKEAFEKIKERLEELINEPRCLHEYDDCCDGLNEAIKIVSEVEAEYGNGWIPCSEKLPEENSNALLQDQDGNYALGRLKIKDDLIGFETGEYWEWWTHVSHYTAWQRLPEPYKGVR